MNIIDETSQPFDVTDFASNVFSESLSISDFESAESAHTDSSSDFGLLELASAMNELSEELLLAQHGYVKDKMISETLQGNIFSAKLINNDLKYVAIKQSSKLLTSKRESIDNDGFNFIVDENICSEAIILRHLTQDNNKTDSIIKYIDFFESDTDYYLVMEYIDSNMNLKQFVLKAHEYIKNGQLKLKQYHKILKYLLWQIIVTINWLHNNMNCCHMDLCPENIMLENVYFTSNSDGSVDVNSVIKVKLIDFGVGLLFNHSEKDEEDSKHFTCSKQHLSIENEQYLAPNVKQQSSYNAKACDLWSFGMILYFCCFGEYPFEYIQQTEFNEPIVGTGYWAIHTNQLTKWLSVNHLLHFINPKLLSLLNGLLNTNEETRLNSENVMKHKWFSTYYHKLKI